jgi:serine protease Do
MKYYIYGFIACMISSIVHAEDVAKVIFEQSAPMVYQIKIIDKASGNKSTIGSGFQVSSTGMLATNYHVVSDYILDKDKFTIEVLDYQNNSIEASLINFDIVHDLALVHVIGLEKQAFKLSSVPMSQGVRIYSMGNPNDLGMTIIEGTYNGLVEASRYQKYLFSGSLNSGMSGGPVLNNAAEVIGINVSKSVDGEQISFLVPVKHLIDLIAQSEQAIDEDEYYSHALAYLMADQQSYYDMLLANDWVSKKFQQFELPDQLHSSLKCWGHTLDNEGARYDETHRHCTTEDEVFLNSDFYTGSLSFDYESIKSVELNTPQFYKLLEQNYVMDDFSNSESKDDTSNFSCTTDFVVLGGKTEKHDEQWKVTTCIREYIDYRGLYDAGLIAMYADSEGAGHKALMITLNVTGIDKGNIKRLHKMFLGSVKWNR